MKVYTRGFEKRAAVRAAGPGPSRTEAEGMWI